MHRDVGDTVAPVKIRQPLPVFSILLAPEESVSDPFGIHDVVRGGRQRQGTDLNRLHAPMAGLPVHSLVGAGEDAGYIYMLYGFSLIRELELHREAGFHPIDVIQNATGNNARILGKEDVLGRVRAGYLADLILVDGNPLDNLKYLYPTGVMEMVGGELAKKGGVQWAIKDGFVYNAPALLEDVKRIVSDAKESHLP